MSVYVEQPQTLIDAVQTAAAASILGMALFVYVSFPDCCCDLTFYASLSHFILLLNFFANAINTMFFIAI